MDKRIKRELGVFGPRNSGKTTFWACLYGSKGSAEGHASFTDEPTLTHLHKIWQSLEAGIVAPATAQGDPQNIPFDLHSNGVTWTVSSRDYSGSLVELPSLRGQDGALTKDLRRRVAEWIRGCDALLVLVPADLVDQDDEVKLRFRSEMDVLLAAFGNSAHAKPMPVCVAITKSDLLATGTLSGEFLKTAVSPWIRELLERIEHQFGSARVAIFGTSAFGGHAEHSTGNPPAGGPQPQQLEESLVWAMRESDRCLFEGAKDVAQRSLGKRLRPRFGEAVKVCRSVRGKGLPSGNAEELDSLLVRVQQAHAARRRRGVVYAVVCAILVGASCLWLHGDHLRRSALAAMATGNINADSLSSVSAFLESRNPAILLLPTEQRTRARDWYAEQASQEARRAHDALTSSADIPELPWQTRKRRAEMRITACTRFTTMFSRRPESADFNRDKSAAEALAAEMERYGPFDTAFSALKDALKSAGSSRSEADAAISPFLTKYAETQYPLRPECFQWIKDKQDTVTAAEKVRKMVDRYGAVLVGIQRDPTSYSNNLKDIALWLTDYNALHQPPELQQQAQTLNKKCGEIGMAWDESEYTGLCAVAARMFESPNKLDDAIRAGDDYVAQTRDTTAMRVYVGDWLSYARALKSVRPVHVQACHINVQRCGGLKSIAGDQYLCVDAEVRGGEKQGWEQSGNLFECSVADDADTPAKQHSVTIALTGQLAVTITRKSWRRSDVSRRCEQLLLRLLEGGQQVGGTEAQADVDVDSASLRLRFSGLPEKKGLPPYARGK